MNDAAATPKAKVERSSAALAMDEAAKAALERSDAAELHEHYKRAVKRCDDLGAALTTVAAHFIGNNDTPRYAPSEGAIEAMERVAIAAIDLAKAALPKETR